jgi:UDP-glucose-4-epimerase GalE
MDPQRILVTGGAGYIGSHTAKELIRRGYEPVTLDNLSTGHRSLVRGELVEADLRDIDALRDTFKKYSFAAVIHFAALCYVGESVKEPMRYYEGNVLHGLNLLGAMIEHNVRRIIFSSSAATYGIPMEIPIPEDHKQVPINPYGQTKSLFEDILRSHERIHGVRSVSLRYFNAAGADPGGELGEIHDPETHLIPIALDAAIGRVPHIEVYGADYNTPDGTCVRDFIHVADLADAHVRALEYLLDGGPTTAFNVGTGTGYSVAQMLDAAERVTGHKIPRVLAPRRPGDPPILVARVDKIKGELGWWAQHSSLDEILSTAWRWQKRLREHTE